MASTKTFTMTRQSIENISKLLYKRVNASFSDKSYYVFDGEDCNNNKCYNPINYADISVAKYVDGEDCEYDDKRIFMTTSVIVDKYNRPVEKILRAVDLSDNNVCNPVKLPKEGLRGIKMKDLMPYVDQLWYNIRNTEKVKSPSNA